MTPCILTLNAGSSSVKYALFDARAAAGIGSAPALRAGQVDGIGTRSGPPDHAAALAEVMRHIGHASVVAVGHRIVHGGARFQAPCRIDALVLEGIEALSDLAPLHQPHNLAGVRAAQQAFSGVPQVACFDTAFHQRMPSVQQRFALPEALFEQGIRRYGFHGLSYESILGQLHAQHPALAAGRVVIAHLGNGCSMAAVQAGRPIATTMSFSPLDGLTMGTRCGRIDAAVVLHLQQREGWPVEEIAHLLHKGSGLLGLSGLSSDMRELEAAAATGHAGAQRAIDHFLEQALRELAGLAAAMRGLDGLVLTGGIGENAVALRSRLLADAAWLGIAANPQTEVGPCLTLPGSAVQALVMHTDEEAVIARHTGRLTASA